MTKNTEEGENKKNEQFVGVEIRNEIAYALKKEVLRQSIELDKRVFMRDIVEESLCDYLGLKYEERGSNVR